MKVLHIVAFILTIVGALNWGLVGLGMLTGANWNLVNMLAGSMPTVEAVVYVLVGVSAILLVVTHKRDCRACASSTM